MHTPIPDCIDCSSDAECPAGCLIAPQTCVEGRCMGPSGCPVITIPAGDPLGARGKLLATVQVPSDVPGKGTLPRGRSRRAAAGRRDGPVVRKKKPLAEASASRTWRR
ncbi:MAG TPA: hypothetical protein VNO26_02165 [Candidatus Limnocylindria bacterium]|nr:hypothetical protein [Candidatus Limnocylindria bacterium]